MSPSEKKTYIRGYFDAKTDAGRNKRLSWMIERLNENLKPNVKIYLSNNLNKELTFVRILRGKAYEYQGYPISLF
jgi:hypothetical protein